MYTIQLLEEAKRSLALLDKSVARRIIRKVRWLAENADSVKPDPLRKNLSGNAKLREGDYRIIYQIFREDELIVVRFIGHRSEVYKGR